MGVLLLLWSQNECKTGLVQTALQGESDYECKTGLVQTALQGGVLLHTCAF